MTFCWSCSAHAKSDIVCGEEPLHSVEQVVTVGEKWRGVVGRGCGETTRLFTFENLREQERETGSPLSATVRKFKIANDTSQADCEKFNYDCSIWKGSCPRPQTIVCKRELLGDFGVAMQGALYDTASRN